MSGGLVIETMLNGVRMSAEVDPGARLSAVLREQFALKGVKVGCDAGDCGACTVLLNGRQVCACLTPAARMDDAMVVTIEGMLGHGRWSRIQEALHRHGAAQCGICMPGMVMAATELVADRSAPTPQDVRDAMAGVLCRCTGYQKIVEAVLAAAAASPELQTAAGEGAVGARIARVDGVEALDGKAIYGADVIPDDALWLRILRSPHARARVTLGDLGQFAAAHDGIARILTTADVTGSNIYGIYPQGKDQVVFADGETRYRGDPVVAVVGEREAVAALDLETLPVQFEALDAITDLDAAKAAGALLLHGDRPGNLLAHGRVVSGDVAAALAASAHIASARAVTGFVEHAYIETEAGYAVRVGDRVEIHATTQSPYLDRDEVAHILGIAAGDVRIVPTSCGGGFGGKLDLSVQPAVALAAWLLGRPVAMVYTRPESMAASSKRHPARIEVTCGCDSEGHLTALDFKGEFNTGAYASWGPTVADRVPVHASGPYRVPNVHAESWAYHTHLPPAGAFRGFGVPQAAIALERALDDLALKLGQDRLEFRLRNALRVGDRTPSGQLLQASVGQAACLEALRPAWKEMLAMSEVGNGDRHLCHGAGVASMWYGIGNTGMTNPSEMRIGLTADGQVVLHTGAVDIGQGSNTVMAQICAEVLGLSANRIEQVRGDTDRTGDAGKSSASRQTYVSGKAAELATRDLRARILRLANAGDDARLTFDGACIKVSDGEQEHAVELAALVADGEGFVLLGRGRFDPETTALDADGQGIPYACYGFGAQAALVEVDRELGLTKVLRITAAHDVGRAINPTLVEGQILGGIAQGLGMALMEEYLPGETEDLHNYLIPTFGDMPEVEILLIEDPEPSGPFGAKGVGEPALIPTAAAIANAICAACGVVPDQVPITPARLRRAILATASR